MPPVHFRPSSATPAALSLSLTSEAMSPTAPETALVPSRWRASAASLACWSAAEADPQSEVVEGTPHPPQEEEAAGAGSDVTVEVGTLRGGAGAVGTAGLGAMDGAAAVGVALVEAAGGGTEDGREEDDFWVRSAH